jgi:hypothetical protein
VRFYRRSRLRSSRGHVRIEQRSPWMRWAVWGGAGLAVVIVAVIVIAQLVHSEDKKASPGDNRTWLEYAWTSGPVNPNAVRQLGERLKENAITRVYLEAAAWRTDGSLLEGEYAAEFAQALRDADPGLKILLWVRMSGDEIKQADRRAAAVDLADKAVHEWEFDGVQLNGRAVFDGSESYIQLVRDLRSGIGEDGALLSLTVPPDRVPSDPSVPANPTVEPDLTWGVDYKQRVGLLGVDEVVVMAHASGLTDPAQYEVWVAYQVETYASAMAELERPPDILIALPTYDEAPEHDPAVENIPSAVRGVRAGIKGAGKDGKLVKGVGLYEYKTTDSLEWTLYSDSWLKGKSE